MTNAWPIARLELFHPARWRVTDIGTVPGAFDAAFEAAGRIVGIAPQLLSYEVKSTYSEADEALNFEISLEPQLDGVTCRGTGTGYDLIRCSSIAWLDAAAWLVAARS